MSDSLWPHGLQHTGLPCPSPTPGAFSNSYPLSWWCHPTISSSVVPFSCLQSFPAAGSFPMSQFFTSSGQSNGVSASASVLPVNNQDWFPLWWTGLISLLSKGLSRVHSNTTVQKHPFFVAQLSLWPNSHIHTWLLGKKQSFSYRSKNEKSTGDFGGSRGELFPCLFQLPGGTCILWLLASSSTSRDCSVASSFRSVSLTKDPVNTSGPLDNQCHPYISKSFIIAAKFLLNINNLI